MGRLWNSIVNARKQIKGMMYIRKKYGDNLPSIENYENPISYSLPFENEWLAVNGGITEEYSHSWQITSQRYAYDFIMVDEKGISFYVDENNPEDYYCYNRKILAPADGTVVDIHDGEPDSLILGLNKYKVRSKHIAGNYIIIKHSETEYSTLAHLAPGSIVVRVGDSVIRGQYIASCGNTGNSTEPHLHFQVQCGEDFFGSYTYPILFQEINRKPCAPFQSMDPRPVPKEEELGEGRIARGYLVSNIK